MKIFVTNKIPHYREFLFRETLKEWEVILSDNSELTIHFKGFLKSFHLTKVWRLNLAECDELVMPFNIRDLSLIYLVFSRHRKKIKLWGIGVRTEPFWRIDDSYIKLRRFLVRNTKATLLYYEAATVNYIGINNEKLFVLNNTIERFNGVNYFKKINEESYFLIIGSITRLKGLAEIISIFKDYVDQGGPYSLKIVGDVDREVHTECLQLITKHSLTQKISFEGVVVDPELKSKIFASAVATLFYSQAGLGVIESMMYSTPVIARTQCITGGEVFAVRNGYNGYLIDDDIDYVRCLMTLSNSDLLNVMQEKSRLTYSNLYSPQQTVLNFKRFLCY